MNFNPIFLLLQNETSLAVGTLTIGLTALRNATVVDKAAFYSGFFNLSIAFERVMKLIVVVDHMLQNDFAAPTKSDLKQYGHNLVTLYASSVAAASRTDVANVNMPLANSAESDILEFLSEFAKSSRYYNLNSLRATPTSDKDPLARWEIILDKILAEDVPKRKIQAALAKALNVHNSVADNSFAIQHGMSGALLTLRQVFTVPAKHAVAAPYVLVRVFSLLTPLLETVTELGKKGFYGSPSDAGCYVPLFGETLVYFGGSDAKIRRKKRWP